MSNEIEKVCEWANRQQTPTARSTTVERGLLGFSGVALAALVIVWMITPSKRTQTSAPTSVRVPHVYQSRESRIDAFVDQQIDKHWRPTAGGNSREDAARVTKDILKARSYEELDRVIQFHMSEGR